LLVRWFAALAGLAAVLGAMVSLTLPLALHVADRRGEPIVCGTGWHGDPAAARQEDAFNRQQHLLVGAQFVVSDYAGECERRVADRRWLAAAVAGSGAALTLTAFAAPVVVGDRSGRRRRQPAGGGPDTDSLTSATW